VIENADGIWITLADGLGDSTRAAAASAVALGALRASRRSRGDIGEALVVMHQTLRELPGPRAEMTAVAARWDPATHELTVANCGHVPPVILRRNGDVELVRVVPGPGLGGRSSPKPAERRTALGEGDRLVMVSDGVIECGDGNAGLGIDGTIRAALRSERESAADTVRQVHGAVLALGETLTDDATVVCLCVE
jgi:serine phosphatase RsbU (regulator of sigma subunit)